MLVEHVRRLGDERKARRALAGGLRQPVFHRQQHLDRRGAAAYDRDRAHIAGGRIGFEAAPAGNEAVGGAERQRMLAHARHREIGRRADVERQQIERLDAAFGKADDPRVEIELDGAVADEARARPPRERGKVDL